MRFSLLAFLVALPVAQADTLTVGDPQHPADLPAAIAQAHAQGAKDITIAPGTYDIPAAHHDIFSLDRWSDTTIHAAGATFLFEETSHPPAYLYGCTRVTWDGGTFLFGRPAFTQGRITAIGADATGAWCDWSIDTGYPAYEPSFNTWINIVDQKTRLLKVNTGDWSPRIEQTGPGRYRLLYAADHAPKIDVNDWLVARAPGGEHLFHLERCEACTLENVTLQNGGFAALFDTSGVGGNRYLKCTIEPGPRPPGATEDQLVACGADGFHSSEDAIGPDIEDCVFRGIFLDDCIAIHGKFSRVLQTDGHDVTLAAGEPPPKVGDPLRIADMKGFFGVATCTAVEPASDQTIHVTLDQDLKIPIDHTEDADPKKGTKASDPRLCGAGYKILRCHLGHTRSRGILVKADDGVIDGNTIEGCGMSGVSIGPEFWWNEAGYCWNVTVSNNTFHNCDQNNSDQATVWIHGDGAMGNRNITIQANTFNACLGEYIIRANYADGVQITGNHFAHSFEIKPWNPGHVISLQQTKNVKLLDNVVGDQGPFAGDLVGLDPSATPDDVQGNNSSGIKTQ